MKLRLVWVLLLACSCAAPREIKIPEVPRQKPLPPPGKVHFSVQGRLCTYDTLGVGPANVHIHAAIHGNEPEGIELVRRLVRELTSSPDLFQGLRLVVVEEANPDGLVAKTRYNANGVDLNRNFAARNWRKARRGRTGSTGERPLSEPETRALVEWFERYPPLLVLTLHSAAHCVNWDGPCEDLAREMSELNGYRLAPTIGYATPGSLGSWMGKDRQVPVLTLELRRASPDVLWRENREALLAAIRWARNRARSATLQFPEAG